MDGRSKTIGPEPNMTVIAMAHWTVIDLSGIEMGGPTELNSNICPSYRPSTVHFDPRASSLDLIHFAYHFLGVR